MLSKNANTLLIILFVAGLGIGSVGTYFLGPKQIETETQTVTVNPLEGQHIQLGFICSDTPRLEQEAVVMREIVQPDLNEYLAKLEQDITVEILIDNADSQSSIHLEKVQSFKSIDVNLMIAGEWSGQAQAALSYVNDNDMLMVSPSSTSPLLCLPDDNLFRLCPSDLVGAPIVADVLWSWGIEAVIVMQRGDAWGDGLYNVLETSYQDKGGVIIERIRYATEAKEFSNYLHTMNNLLGDAIADYGAEHVGIVFFALTEAPTIITQSVDYPHVREVIWMGTEDIGRRQIVIDDAGEEAVPLRCFGSLIAPTKSYKWVDFEERFYDETGVAATFYRGVLHDVAFTILTGVLETDSLDAVDVIKVYPDICSSYFGVTGWCDLDENGDRKPSMLETWGYAYVDGEPGFKKYAEVDAITGTVNWDYEVLAEEGLEIPGH